MNNEQFIKMLDSSRRNAFLHLIHKNRWDNKWNLKDNKYTKFDNLYEIIIDGKTYVIEYEPERDICTVIQNYKEHKCRTFKDFLIMEEKKMVSDITSEKQVIDVVKNIVSKYFNNNNISVERERYFSYIKYIYENKTLIHPIRYYIKLCLRKIKDLKFNVKEYNYFPKYIPFKLEDLELLPDDNMLLVDMNFSFDDMIHPNFPKVIYSLYDSGLYITDIKTLKQRLGNKIKIGIKKIKKHLDSFDIEKI